MTQTNYLEFGGIKYKEVNGQLYAAPEEVARMKTIREEEDRADRNCQKLILEIREILQGECELETFHNYFGDLVRGWALYESDSTSYEKDFQELIYDMSVYSKYGI